MAALVRISKPYNHAAVSRMESIWHNVNIVDAYGEKKKNYKKKSYWSCDVQKSLYSNLTRNDNVDLIFLAKISTSLLARRAILWVNYRFKKEMSSSDKTAAIAASVWPPLFKGSQ